MTDNIIHASAVSVDTHGVLIIGPSGCGKSSLALRLIALGGKLIADDQVVLNKSGEILYAAAPRHLAGLIEARGVGLIRIPFATAPIHLVIDLEQAESERLPPIRHTNIRDVLLPLVLGPLTDHLHSVVTLLLRGALVNPDDVFLSDKP